MARRVEHPARGWAGTYGRLSMLPRFTQTHSPENQDRLNKQAALTHGLKIKPGYEFYDEESAYRNVRRRDFERAIAALLNQEIEALIVPKLDRLSRRGMGQVGLLLDDLERVGGRIISVGDGLDSSQPGARQIIAFLAEQARTEVLNTAWRVEQFHEGARRAGQWVRKPPYGYLVENGKLKPHPVQAPIVRRIIDDFLNGATLRSLAVALNRDKIPNPTTARILEAKQAGRTLKGREDGSWGYTTVRRVLVNPALCGWQTHEGRVVLGDNGEPVSFGEGLIEPVEHVRILTEMERRTALVRRAKDVDRIGSKTGGGRPAKYLLTGFARCASCGYACTLFVQKSPRPFMYYCSGRANGHICVSPASVRMVDADAEVMRQLTMRLAAMDLDDPILGAIAERWLKLTMPAQEGDRAILEAKLGDIRSRIASLDEARYGRGEFDTVEDVARWEQLRANLIEQRSAVQAALDELGPPPAFDIGVLLDTYRSREAWQELTLHHQRALLGVAVQEVVIKSARRGKVPLDERVRVILAGEQGG
jgi:site-specific DNA recombinase